MTSSVVPATGLSLSGAPDTEIGMHKPQHKPLQAFRVELPVALAEELRKHAAGKPNGIQLTCGRSPILKIGGKSHDLSSTPQTLRRELYSSKDGSKLSFAAIMSHRLQLQTVEKVTKGADAALLALQSNMAALEKEKKSNTTLFVKDRSSLGIPESGKVKYNKGRLANNGTTHSKPTSPSLGSSQPSTARVPTSAPLDQRTLKTQALRRALIHLLAIKPGREETLIQKTRGSKAECVEILEKCGERCESDTKWQLDKRSYRELDVWRFPYPSRDDRQAAIDHAATAYDRLRLSREDKLWQMLLPERERGKGKILSKLSLHNGPIGRSNTPTIKVQRTADSNSTDSDSQRKSDASDSDPKSRKLAPAARSREGSESERSQSSTPMNRKKLSEREALSKRLLSKNPKKPARPAEKAKAGKASGRSEKTNGKIKSSEYIEDSSDEADMADSGEAKPSNSDGEDPAELANTLAAIKHAKATKTGLYSKITKPSVSGSKDTLKGVKTGRVEKSPRPTEAAKSRSTTLPAKPQSAIAKSPSSSSASRDDLQKKLSTNSKARSSDKSPSGAEQASKKRPPPPATTTTTTDKSSKDKKPSTSYPPKATKTTSKPSPLGSSPPTNASDFDSAADDSSSSSTPLISQVRRNQAAQSRSSNSHAAAQRAAPAPKVNGTKRKANEHEDDRRQESSKRRQASSISSPPPSSSSSAAAASSNSYNSSSASPPTSYHVLQLAKKFKDYYAGYERLYSELVRMADPPAEKVKRVKEMHSRLEGMKMEISRSAAS